MNLNTDSSWNSGDKVVHDSFGEGIVVGVKGETVSIAFGSPHGIKINGVSPSTKKRG